MAKRFTWRLDSVRKARERHEDLKKQALGEAQGAQNIEEGKLSDMQNHKQGQTDRLRSNQSGKLNPRDLQAAHEYISDLDKKIEEQQERVDQAKQVTEDRHENLVKAVQENKVLENLRTRDHASFKKEGRRREQAESDETANRTAHRSRQENSEP